MKTFFTFQTVIFWCPYSITSMEWGGLRRVVPAAAVTTHAKPHAQQQLARSLAVERAAMGQRCRPQCFGELQRGNPQPCRWSVFLCTAALLLYSYNKSRVRACELIPMYHTEGAALSCCRPPISEGHPISMVCSRLGVRLYSCCSTLRAWSPVCGSTLRVSQAAKAMMAARGERAYYFLFF